MFAQRVREDTERVAPLTDAVRRSPTDKVLFEILALQRNMQEELEVLTGLVEALDEPQSDPDLMAYMCLSRDAALDRAAAAAAAAAASERSQPQAASSVGSLAHASVRTLELQRNVEGLVGVGLDKTHGACAHITSLSEARRGELAGDIGIGDAIVAIDGHPTTPLSGASLLSHASFNVFAARALTDVGNRFP